MKRMLFDDLLRWKERDDRKPLILKGVRQCGKTFLLREFGRECYPDAAYFNFEGNAELRERFAQNLDVERIILELGALRKKKIDNDTLIIFDEIQFCGEALTSLKYFAENMPQQHIVCAGSLLGVALSKAMSFPVGKVDFLTLRPMNFFEFLLAMGEELLCEHLKNMSVDEKISPLFRGKLEEYLRYYLIVGGMPEAVLKWADTRDLAATEAVQQKILDSYELDFAKHAPLKDYPKMSMIWRSVPEQLARENRKFIYNDVKRGLRSKDLEDALEWLVSAGMVFKIEKISKPGIPLSAYADKSYFKLYFSDVGLLRKIARLPAEAIIEKNSDFTEFKGAMTENYVLCEFVFQEGDKPYYWKSANTAEVDFVAQFGVDIVPIEVKSDRNTKTKSLSVYRGQYEPRVSVVTSMEDVSGREVRRIPLYMLWRMRDYVLDKREV